MTKPYVRITVDGPKLGVDEGHPLPKPLPEGVTLAKGPSYSWCAGTVGFGEFLHFDWEITVEEISPEVYLALQEQGWSPCQGHTKKGHRRLSLADPEVLVIPSKEVRPEVWPPAGFTKVKTEATGHIDLVDAEVMEGSSWGFCISTDQYPVLPLITFGQLWTEGWDIPTCYAIDANRQCWMDSGHGAQLVPVEPSALLSEAGSSHAQEEIRKHLGMKPKLPSWVQAARTAGWTPPEGWDESGYEV